VRPPPAGAVEVLERGTLCYLAVATRRGPHVTPVVYAWSGGDIWITTSRSSAKAAAWRRSPAVAGLVRRDDAEVAFAGAVQIYDAFAPHTWPSSIAASPALLAATLRFGRKNARYYAGYAIDALHIPLPWTPPGRLLARVTIERGALMQRGRRTDWGAWRRGRRSSATAFRRRPRPVDPLGHLPADVGSVVGRRGSNAVIAVDGPSGLTVLPAGWVATGGEVYAAIPGVAATLAGPRVDGSASLAVDRASSWRARDMVGAMLQGEASGVAVDGLSSGRASAARLARSAGIEADGALLVRIIPRRLVWWRGWNSGSVAPGDRTDDTDRPAAARP
jgi:Pyridoxamine 5'-phosphate oxidase